MGDPTTRNREPEVLGLAVELTPGEPGLGTSGSRLRVHPYALHRREVYDDTPVARRVAGHGVASAAHRHHQFILAGEVHCGGDICNAGAASDQRRSAVYHRVEDGAGCIVAVVLWAYQLAAEGSRELLHSCFFEGFAQGHA